VSKEDVGIVFNAKIVANRVIMKLDKKMMCHLIRKKDRVVVVVLDDSRLRSKLEIGAHLLTSRTIAVVMTTNNVSIDFISNKTQNYS
jgi:hypothetical protein